MSRGTTLTPEAELARIRNGIKQSLEMTEKQAPRAAGGNLVTIMAEDPDLGTQLAVNDMSQSLSLSGGEFGEPQISNIQKMLLVSYGLNFSRGAISDEARSQGERHRFNPVKAYLESLPTWDGTSRMQSILEDVLHVEATVLNKLYISKWLTAAVKRIMEPGCKFDSLLVLVGPQGRRKGMFYETLGGDFYGSPDFGSRGVGDKDSKMGLFKNWINEIQEVDKLNGKVDARELKTLLSTREDQFRPPYGHKVETYKRQFVLAGSANEPEGLLVDHTGNRRWWIIEIGDQPIDIELLITIKDQLWAEAVALNNSGYQIWLDEDQQSAQSEASVQFEAYDPYTDLLSAATARLEGAIHSAWHRGNVKGLRLQEIFDCMELPEHLRVSGSAMAVRVLGPHLRKNGWGKEKRGTAGTNQAWRWYPRNWDEIVARKGTGPIPAMPWLGGNVQELRVIPE